jgi:hypothetical protein
MPCLTVPDARLLRAFVVVVILHHTFPSTSIPGIASKNWQWKYLNREGTPPLTKPKFRFRTSPHPKLKNVLICQNKGPFLKKKKRNTCVNPSSDFFKIITKKSAGTVSILTDKFFLKEFDNTADIVASYYCKSFWFFYNIRKKSQN